MSSDGKTLTGKATVGSELTFYDEAGVKLGGPVTVTSADGSFSASLTAAPGVGKKVKVVSKKGGEEAKADTPAYQDLAEPTDIHIGSDGKTVTGKGIAGSKAVVLDAAGKEIGSGEVKTDGTFKITLEDANKVAKGGKVKVELRSDGNTTDTVESNAVTEVVVPHSVAIALDGATVTGKAPKGSTITIKDKNGLGLQTTEEPVVADDSGNFTAHLKNALKDAGDKVKVSAKLGSDVSEEVESDPLAEIRIPYDVVLMADGVTVTGRAQAGAKIHFENASGAGLPLEVTADEGGSFVGRLDHNYGPIKARASFGSRPSKLSEAVNIPQLDAPTNVEISMDGATVTGHATKGSSIQIFDEKGLPRPTHPATVTAGDDGEFTAHLKVALVEAGAKVKVQASFTDSEGNTKTSDFSATAILKEVAAPIELSIASDGLTVTGRAQSGAMIKILNEEGHELSTELVSGLHPPVAGSYGHFTATLKTKLDPGNKVRARAFFGSRESDPSDVAEVYDLDAPSGVALAMDGVTVKGWAPKGSKITIKDKNGDKLETTEEVTAGEYGDFTATLKNPLTTGAQVRAVANKDSTHHSPDSALSNALDAVDAPTEFVLHGNGVVTGRAQARVMIILKDNDGHDVPTVPNEVIVFEGYFTAKLKDPLKPGAQVKAKAVYGERESEFTDLVEAPAPDAPENVQLALDGVTVTGTAHPGAKIVIKKVGGSDLPTQEASVVADALGHFTAHLQTPLTDKNDKVKASAAVGSRVSPDSDPSAALGDVLAPTEVSIASDGKTVTGKAQSGAKIKILDEGGNELTTELVFGHPPVAGTDGHFMAKLTTGVGTGQKVKAKAVFGERESELTDLAEVYALDAPRDVALAMDGVTVTGKAPKGSKITIKDKDGTGLETMGEVTADSDGNFTATLKNPLTTDAQVRASAKDGSMRSLDSALSNALDAVDAPTDVVVKTDRVTVTGHAQKGAKIALKNDADEVLPTTAEVVADASGNFVARLKTKLPDGKNVKAKASFGFGRDSEFSDLAEVSALDAPENVALAMDGATVTGKAKPGLTITIKDKGGNPLETTETTVTADVSGKFTAHLKHALDTGAQIRASANDGTNDSANSPLSAALGDVTKPTDVVIQDHGMMVMGHAQEGAKIVVTDKDGHPLETDGPVIADDTGEFYANLKTPLAEGALFRVKASFGTRESVLTDTVAVPDFSAPVDVHLAMDGVTVTGKAPEGSKITIKDKDGNPLETQGDVTGKGPYSPFEGKLKNPLGAGAQVKAAASKDGVDSADSALSDALGDVTTPTEFYIGSDRKTVRGRAQPGAKISFKDDADGVLTTTDPVIADSEGNFRATLTNPLTAGKKIKAQASFGVGRDSEFSGLAGVPDLDAPVDVQLALDGVTVTGKAPANSTVTIMGKDGKELQTTGEVTADPLGGFTAQLKQALDTGAQVKASAVKDGKHSPDSFLSAALEDVSAPTEVSITVDGKKVTGYADKGAKIVLTDDAGAVLETDAGPVIADSSGAFTATLKTPAAKGAKIKAQASFGVGRDSEFSDLAEVPTVYPPMDVEIGLDGKSVMGKAYPNATITIFDQDGNPLEMEGGTTALFDGTFSVGLKAALGTGAQVKAVAEFDGVKSTESAWSNLLADVAAPVVGISADGKTVTGHAQKGAQIVLTDEAGIRLETEHGFHISADRTTGEFTATLITALGKGAKIKAKAFFGDRESDVSEYAVPEPSSGSSSGAARSVTYALDLPDEALQDPQSEDADGKESPARSEEADHAAGAGETAGARGSDPAEVSLGGPSRAASAPRNAPIIGEEKAGEEQSLGMEAGSAALKAIDKHEAAGNSPDQSLDRREESPALARSAEERGETGSHQTETAGRDALADVAPAQTEKGDGAAAPQGAARASERSEAADARETAPDQGQEGGKLAETSADGAVQPALEAVGQSEALNPAHVELAWNPEPAAAPAPMFLGSGYDFGSLNLSTESLAPANAGDEGLWAPGSGLGVVDFAAGADEPAPTIGANVINLGGKEGAHLPGEADDDKPQSSEAHYEYGSDGSLSDSAGGSPLDQNGHHGIL